jgi:hypothetical protein
MALHPINFLVIITYNYRVFLTKNSGSGPTFLTFESLTYSQSFARKSKIKNQKSQNNCARPRPPPPPAFPLNSYTLIVLTFNIYLLNIFIFLKK